MEKPPLAPKPKYIPLQQALNVDCSQSPINAGKSTHVSQPYLSKPPTPEWKPVSVFTSDHHSHFQQVASSRGLLHPRTKDEYDIESGQASASSPHEVHHFSDDPVTHSRSHRTVKNYLNLINGSLGSEKNATGIPDAPHVSSPSRLLHKSAESKPVLLIPTQRRHSDEHGGHSSAVLLSVHKASPISVLNKAKSGHVGHPEKPDVTSQKKGGYDKPKYKALTVKESNLAQTYKEGRTPKKQATTEKKSRRTPEIQNNDVELLGNYPHWKLLSSEQKTGQDVPNDTRSENTPRKKSGITLKPKVKSLNQADLKESSDGQRKSSFKKLKDFEFSVKKLPKLFSKGAQGPEIASGNDEQSVDDGWHITRNQNRSRTQIPQYRTHHVNIQQEEFTLEHSVDGYSVEGEHLYYDVLDNVCGMQTPQTPTNWQRNGSDKEEKMNGKIGESNTRVGQDYNKR